MQRSLQHENNSRRFYSYRAETTIKALFYMGQRLGVPSLLIVAPTHNALDVIRERLLYLISLFKAYIRQWNRIYSCIRRIKGESDIRNVSHANQSQRSLEIRLSMYMIDICVQLIILCTLGSV